MCLYNELSISRYAVDASFLQAVTKREFLYSIEKLTSQADQCSRKFLLLESLNCSARWG